MSNFLPPINQGPINEYNLPGGYNGRANTFVDPKGHNSMQREGHSPGQKYYTPKINKSRLNLDLNNISSSYSRLPDQTRTDRSSVGINPQQIGNGSGVFNMSPLPKGSFTSRKIHHSRLTSDPGPYIAAPIKSNSTQKLQVPDFGPINPFALNPYAQQKKPRKKVQDSTTDILDIHINRQNVLLEKMGEIVANQQTSRTETYKSQVSERLKQLQMEQQMITMEYNRFQGNLGSGPKKYIDHAPALPRPKKKHTDGGGFKMQDLMYGFLIKKMFEDDKKKPESDSSSSSDSDDGRMNPYGYPPYGYMQGPMMMNLGPRRGGMGPGGMYPGGDGDDTSRKKKSTGKKKTTKKETGPSPEEIKKMEQEKKDKAKRNLRIYLWTTVYFNLLHNSVRTSVLEKREQVQTHINDQIALCYDTLKGFIAEQSGKLISNMLMDKNHNYIFVTDKKLNDKKADKMTEALCDHFKHILDKLVNNTKNLPKHVFEFLAVFSEEGAILPYDFISEFELKRLQFNHFGSLKDQTAPKSKMLIGGFVIIRLFVQKCIMRCTESLKLNKKNINLEKLLNIGSFIYNVAFDVVRSGAIAYPKNQDHLHPEYKMKAKKNLHKAMELFVDDGPLNVKVEKDATKDGEIIEGFFAKAQLDTIFKQRGKMVDKVKALVTAWLDKLYELSHAEYEKNKPKKDDKKK